ncbi:unnamed protein product [Trichobilharzia regenti]|nr:unnamed protein product [Trichobilharzia regenti]
MGSVTRKPTYIHLKISTGFLKHTSPTHHLSSSTNEDTASRINEQKNILFEKDLILLPNVFNSTTVATNFEADEQSFEIHFDIEQIHFSIKICHSSNGVVRNASTNYTTVVSKVQRGGYSSFSVYPTNLLNANIQSSLTCSQKFFIMTYLCFRVFYTFLFTISVGLSFVLSIETDATVEFTSAVYNNHFVTMNTLGRYSGSFDSRLNSPSVMSTMPLATDIGNRWRGAKVWVLEAARMEDFAQSELLRQGALLPLLMLFQRLNSPALMSADSVVLKTR